MENIFGLLVDELGDYIEEDHTTGNSYYERFRLQSTRYPKFYSSTGDIRITAWKKVPVQVCIWQNMNALH